MPLYTDPLTLAVAHVTGEPVAHVHARLRAMYREQRWAIMHSPHVWPVYEWCMHMDAWLNDRGYPFADSPSVYPGPMPE